MATPADLTPELLTRLLAAHLGGATVTSVRAEPVGTGQIALCLRLHLGLDAPAGTPAGAPAGAPAGVPATVIAKVPSPDPTSRAAAAALRLYEVEVEFYRSVRPDVAVRTPAVHHADLDVEAGDFLLLMEDVAGATAGDQLAGCGVDEAASAVGELAGLHAPCWGDRRLEGLGWLHRSTEATSGEMPALVRSLHPGFVERYGERVDPDVLAVAERLMGGLDGYMSGRRGPWTVTHGDFRLDNLLFAERDGALVTYVVDWQTAVLGPGVSDLSYFLGAAFEPERRRDAERGLVELYHHHLAAQGVDLAWDDLWRQYRRYSFGGLIMGIAASMLVQQTARGDDMFMAMVRRHGRHAIDLDAADLLG